MIKCDVQVDLKLQNNVNLSLLTFVKNSGQKYIFYKQRVQLFELTDF